VVLSAPQALSNAPANAASRCPRNLCMPTPDTTRLERRRLILFIERLAASAWILLHCGKVGARADAACAILPDRA
jgi:hypothetical protein